MSRRGFALLGVLWFVAASAVVAATALATLQRGVWQGRNRIVLERARWAREACLAMVMAQPEGHAAGSHGSPPESSAAPLPIPRVDLGRGTWCTASVTWPDARLNLNLIGPLTLRALLGRDSLVDALLDWRDADTLPRAAGAEQGWYRRQHRRIPRDGPLADVDELRLIRGYSDTLVSRLTTVTTVDGDGVLDLSRAAPAVLVAVPFLDPAVVQTIRSWQAEGRRLAQVEDLGEELDAVARESLHRAQESGEVALGTGSPACEVRLEGGVAGFGGTSRSSTTLSIASGRFAIIRRRVDD